MCHNKICSPWNYCNCSRIKRNILKTLKVYGLLRFKFPKLTYRKKEWQLPTSSKRPFCQRFCFPSCLPARQGSARLSFAAKTLTLGKLFLSSHFDIEEWTIFENKLFMLFIFFWKQTTLKISVYKLASVCYSFF